MLYNITTTPKTVVDPKSYDRWIVFTSGNFASSATTVYIRPVNSKNVWAALFIYGVPPLALFVPHGTQLEAVTDAGTADLAAMKQSPPMPPSIVPV